MSTTPCVSAVDTCCGQFYEACANHPSFWSRCSVCGKARGEGPVMLLTDYERGAFRTFRKKGRPGQ